MSILSQTQSTGAKRFFVLTTSPKVIAKHAGWAIEETDEQQLN